MRFRLSALSVLLLIPFAASAQQSWNPTAAAAYLDGRSGWWMVWPKAARDHGTFCVSCHTLAPYALARPSLHTALRETELSANEMKLRDNIVRRVRMWREVEPFYADQTLGLPKTSESRGTEAILNALILVTNDAAWNGAAPGKLSPDARLALDNMMALQMRSGEMSGSWAWLQFHNAPWEGDSQFYGTALAAMALGSAPSDYRSDPAVQKGAELLRTWLRKNMDAQTPLDRVVLLWASAKLPGLLTADQQRTIAMQTLAQQRENGGFSTGSLTPSWKRRDNTPVDAASDGYATGLVALAFEQLASPECKGGLARALTWLAKNQNASDGRWAATSLNKQRELESDAGLFMSDAATAYAVMALNGAK